MKALLLIDIQNDFIPGGALAVKEGDEIVPIVNRLQKQFSLIIATQDWHPINHGSFAANHLGKKEGEMIELHGLAQILWPIHCVQNTKGAAFVDGLEMSQVDAIFYKGTDPAVDSYSGFFDNGRRKATGLGDYLRQKEVKEVYIAGLATDYCVKYSALDAHSLGFTTFVIEDACRGVNLQEGDVQMAVAELKEKGIYIIQSESILSS